MPFPGVLMAFISHCKSQSRRHGISWWEVLPSTRFISLPFINYRGIFLGFHSVQEVVPSRVILINSRREQLHLCYSDTICYVSLTILTTIPQHWLRLAPYSLVTNAADWIAIREVKKVQIWIRLVIVTTLHEFSSLRVRFYDIAVYQLRFYNIEILIKKKIKKKIIYWTIFRYEQYCIWVYLWPFGILGSLSGQDRVG